MRHVTIMNKDLERPYRTLEDLKGCCRSLKDLGVYCETFIFTLLVYISSSDPDALL